LNNWLNYITSEPVLKSYSDNFAQYLANITALNNKGLALAKLGRYNESIPLYDKALAIDPNYKDSFDGKGNALYGLGNYTGAILYYDKALAIDPNYKDALNGKQNALRLGNHTQAR
jgi:tetratricopeptide (TPR) repeat protein